jgi:hypothetical protein
MARKLIKPKLTYVTSDKPVSISDVFDLIFREAKEHKKKKLAKNTK